MKELEGLERIKDSIKDRRCKLEQEQKELKGRQIGNILCLILWIPVLYFGFTLLGWEIPTFVFASMALNNYSIKFEVKK